MEVHHLPDLWKEPRPPACIHTVALVCRTFQRKTKSQFNLQSFADSSSPRSTWCCGTSSPSPPLAWWCSCLRRGGRIQSSRSRRPLTPRVTLPWCIASLCNRYILPLSSALHEVQVQEMSTSLRRGDWAQRIKARSSSSWPILHRRWVKHIPAAPFQQCAIRDIIIEC